MKDKKNKKNMDCPCSLCSCDRFTCRSLHDVPAAGTGRKQVGDDHSCK